LLALGWCDEKLLPVSIVEEGMLLVSQRPYHPAVVSALLGSLHTTPSSPSSATQIQWFEWDTKETALESL
jgi:hypothetical protein